MGLDPLLSGTVLILFITGSALSGIAVRKQNRAWRSFGGILTLVDFTAMFIIMAVEMVEVLTHVPLPFPYVFMFNAIGYCLGVLSLMAGIPLYLWVA